jgi:hypothetical protein
MRPTPSQGYRSRRGGRMAAACCTFAVIFVKAWTSISAAAFAQNVSLPQTIGQGRMSSPIGHRQPRAQDLPPDVLRDEGMTRRPPEPAPTTLPDASGDQGDRSAHLTPFDDENLRICRQC